MQITHLHVHTHASFLDSTVQPSDLVKRAKELGMSAVAITDHGNLFNAVEFYTECTEAGIKPILGCEFNFVESCSEAIKNKTRRTRHIVLLAETQEGWNNLVKLVTKANSDGCFYYQPRVDIDMLQEHKNGIIALSACAGGVVASYLKEDIDEDGTVIGPKNYYRAEAAVRMFKSIYGESGFFLEVQDIGTDEQRSINNDLRKMALKYGLKTVVTSNVHYLNKTDNEAHKTLVQIGGNGLRSSWSSFTTEDFYLKDAKELGPEILSAEIEATNEIANRCNVKFDLSKNRLPEYPHLPAGKTSSVYLKELAEAGLLSRNLTTDDYKARLARELGDIAKLGFDDYFLIVTDVISWARSQNILIGPGRGSAGGSLVSYALGITDIDPIKYGLIWERFLNVGRKSLPDIDSDIPRSKRGVVIDYVRTRFGIDNVAQLATFNKLAARAVLKDVFKVFGMDFDQANIITKLLPAKDEDHTAITLEKAIEMTPSLQEYEKQYKPWFAIARSLEGCYKSLGTHAAAVVISDKPFNVGDYPLCRSADSKSLIFGWDMDVVDKLHLLKLDILGLSTLDVIQDSFDLIEKRHNRKIKLAEIPLDDQRTFDLFADGKTIGVFQLEKQLGKTWSKALRPRSIEDISDLVSLIRPGPLETGMVESYQEVTDGQKIPAYPHDSLKPILDCTRGSLIYQEQIIEICRRLAGMSLVDADHVRKAMGKKKPEEMRKWKEVFSAGCIKNGISSDSSEEIWGWIERFAGYGFNKSHGVGYALMAYYTAWLKANYPVEFFCAALMNAKHAQDPLSEIKKFVHDAKIFGIDVTPPRIDVGNVDFAVVNETKIAFGLSSLKGVGEKSISDIINSQLPCDSFGSFLTHAVDKNFNKRVMEALILSGALDVFGESRNQMLAKYQLISNLTNNELSFVKGRQDWIDAIRMVSDDITCMQYKNLGVTIPNVRRRATLRQILDAFDSSPPFDDVIEKMKWEQLYLGISLTASLTDLFQAQNVCSDIVNFGGEDMPVHLAVQISLVKEHTTKKGDVMAFMTAGDETYELDNFVIFPQTFTRYKAILVAGNIVKVSGVMSGRGSIIVNRMERVR